MNPEDDLIEARSHMRAAAKILEPYTADDQAGLIDEQHREVIDDIARLADSIQHLLDDICRG